MLGRCSAASSPCAIASCRARMVAARAGCQAMRAADGTAAATRLRRNDSVGTVRRCSAKPDQVAIVVDRHDRGPGRQPVGQAGEVQPRARLRHQIAVVVAAERDDDQAALVPQQSVAVVRVFGCALHEPGLEGLLVPEADALQRPEDEGVAEHVPVATNGHGIGMRVRRDGIEQRRHAAQRPEAKAAIPVMNVVPDIVPRSLTSRKLVNGKSPKFSGVTWPPLSR